MKGIHVALFCSIPLFTILAPTIREAVISQLLAPSYLIPVYEGDGILVGDPGVSLPWWLNWAFTVRRWTITQKPVFGDAFHAISLFFVPKNTAPFLLYRFDANYTSDYFYVDGGYTRVYRDMQHLDLRSSIYLLPKEYTPGREAKASLLVKVKRESSEYERNRTYVYGSTTCQFHNRALYRNFVDMEPGAVDYSETCRSVLGGATQFKDEGYLKNHSVPSHSFTSTQLQESYNYFSTIVPTQSLVKFEANITMYFYELEKLIEHSEYKCTIRDTDVCSFTTKQKLLDNDQERQLIVAYIHPRAGPFSLTSTVSVTTDVLLFQNAAHLLLYLLIPSFLIRSIFV